MSPQAILLAVVLSIMFILTLALSIRNFSGSYLFAMLLWLAWIAVTVYDTECLVAGDCIIYSWIRTIFYIIMPIIFIILLLSVLFTKRVEGYYAETTTAPTGPAPPATMPAPKMPNEENKQVPSYPNLKM